ncbi:TniQ family protein [Ruegeria lacuscaerulensis]|uniref:TniQ family protein n=1 Tax=Ruegeria lacuscaerulensis TaxID=55218 RepID=UPI001480525F|nr:TniQ family protein [Ruegeria lacuscaerulensis]
MAMRPNLPLAAGESVVSWVNRFGLLHCGLGATEFLKLIGVCQRELISGKRSALERLTEVTGVSFELLALGAYENVSHRLYRFKDEQFHREFLDMNCIQFCPTCLLLGIEDETDGVRAGTFRINWSFAPIRTCAIHRLPLVRKRVAKTWGVVGKYAEFAGNRIALEECLQVSQPRDPSALQLYAEARFERCSSYHWMDSQQIDLACHATEMLGACIEFGAQVTLSKLSEDDWDVAGQTGFEFTSRGEKGIVEGFEIICSRPVTNASMVGPKGIFGKLYEWAQFRKNDKPVGPIQDVFREYILDRFYVPAGSKLFGKTVDRPRRHTVASLSAQYGLHLKTTTHALRKSDLLPLFDRIDDERRTVPADQAEALFEKLSRAIPVAKIPRTIGCSRAQAELLLKSGILKSVIQDDGDTSGRHKGVDSNDLSSLVERMRQTGCSVAQPSEGMSNICDTAITLHSPSMEILTLLLDGHLNKVELLPIDLKFQSVLVNLEEVANKLGVKAGQPGFTISEASRELSVLPNTVRFLLQAKETDGHPVLEASGQVLHMGVMRELVDYESLRKFESRFRKLSAIDGYWNREPERLRKKLVAKGLRPVWDPKVAGAEFYRVSDL